VHNVGIRLPLLLAALLLTAGLSLGQSLNATAGSVAENKKTAREKTTSKDAGQAKEKQKGGGDSSAKADESKSKDSAKALDDKAAPARQEVLEPGQFFGLASFGYASAKAKPEIMEKLFCYCGCDLTDKHTNLLDCFTSMHGVDCHICQEEAILALKMHKEGATMTEIQKAVDEKYSHEYPFEQDTPNYRKYKESRLYLKDAGKQAGGPESPDNKPATTSPTLKPGKKVSKCCEGKEHESADGEKPGKGKAGKTKSSKEKAKH
jgi:hypothetical protein